MCCQPPDVEEQNAYLKAEVDNLENDLEVEVDAHARLVSTNARLRKAQTEADRVLALAQEEFKDPAWDLHTLTFVAAMIKKARNALKETTKETDEFHLYDVMEHNREWHE